MQTTARAQNHPLDQMDVITDLTSEMNPETLNSHPTDGMYIHGLFIESARWDLKRCAVSESVPKQLHPPIPIIRVRGVLHGTHHTSEQYICPTYITSQRGATFVFSAQLNVKPAEGVSVAHELQKWIIAGVCLLMSDD